MTDLKAHSVDVNVTHMEEFPLAQFPSPTATTGIQLATVSKRVISIAIWKGMKAVQRSEATVLQLGPQHSHN